MPPSYETAPLSSISKTPAELVGKTPRITAVRMLASGLWPVPIYPPGFKLTGRDKLSEGKEPIGKAWGAVRNTVDTLAATFKNYARAGVGVALGPGRGPGGAWLIDVEGDGPEAEESRVRLFGGEVVDTLGWGSARGGHMLLIADPARVAELLAPLKGLEGKGLKTGVYHLPGFPGLEIRFGGSKPDGTVKQLQSVFPPTIGTDGKPRQWNGVSMIAPAPEGLYSALRAAAGSARPNGPAAPPPDDASLAADALRHLNGAFVDDYQRWLEVGMSLFSLGPIGLGLWDDWSKGSPKYSTGTCETKWKSFRPEGRALGSLFRWATEAGWTRPRTAAAPRSNGTVPAAATLTDPGRFHLTDMGNGERLVHHHGDDLRHVHPWKTWLVWDGRRWAIDNTAAVVTRAKKTVRGIYREAAATGDDSERALIAKWAKESEKRDRVLAMVTMAASDVPALHEELDRNPWLLNVKNGTVDLRTGELQPHRRGDLITKLAPVAYDQAADCPLWLNTLALVFNGDREMMAFLRRLFGVVLTGCVDEQILPILHGKGSNGKSTIVGTMLALLGPDYAMKAPKDLLVAKRNPEHPTELATLFGKRLVVAIETADGARINEVLVKELTGGDPITARRMHENYWTFNPTHKVMICTNHKPTVRGTDHAIWRRLKLIPFNVTIPDSEADKGMSGKLMKELSGILAWGVRGCLEWQEAGLNPPDAVNVATTEYRQAQDILGAFLADNCTTGPRDQVKASDLFGRYKAWADRTGEHATTQQRFGEALTERGFERFKDSVTYYRGLDLRPEA